MKLYSNLWSRGVTVEWYIRELGIDIEIVTVDYKVGEHKTPEYLKINPMGRIPCLVDGDLNLAESGAILVYLLDKCGGGTQLPLPTRAKLLQWVLFANSTLEECCFGPNRDKQLPEVYGALDRMLGEAPYLTGQDFTVADLAVASTLIWMPMMVKEADPAPYKNIVAFLDRMKARPAYAATFKVAMESAPPM